MSKNTRSPKMQARVEILRKALQVARERFPSGAELPAALNGRAAEAQLHATIVEMIGGFLALFEGGSYAPLPVLLRVAHEALAEQLALERDPEYLRHMVATTFHEARNMPEQVNQQQKGLLQKFLAEPGARDFLGHIKDTAAEIAGDGGERTDPEDKFVAAGLKKEYPLYRNLSGAVHNDFGVLQARHSERLADGRRRLTLSQIPSELDLLNYLDSSLASLLRSFRSFHRGAGALQALIDRFAQQLDAEREERGGEGRRLSQLERYQGTRQRGK